MHQRLKLLMPVLVLGLIVIFSNPAAAQTTTVDCGISSTPVSRGIESDHTAEIGDILVSCQNGTVAGDTTQALLTLEYPVIITTNDAHDFPVNIFNPTGVFSTGTHAVTISNVDPENGIVAIEVDDPADGLMTWADGEIGTFQLDGVLVSLLDAPDDIEVQISLTAGAGFFVPATQDVATVLRDPLPALDELSLNDDDVNCNGDEDEDDLAILFSNGELHPANDCFTFRVREDFIDAFRSDAFGQINGGDSSDPQTIDLEFNGLPVGLEIDQGECDIYELDGTGPGHPLFDLGGDDPLTAEDNVWELEVGDLNPADLADVEGVLISCAPTAFDIDDDELPLATGEVTVRATMRLEGDALDDGDVFEDSTDGGEIPRFEEAWTEELTVIRIPAASTTMLLPFGTTFGGEFFTTIAIANTTYDPWEEEGVEEIDGTIHFYFFPSGEDCIEWESIVIAAGETYAVFLDDILAEAGFSGDFSGYVFAVANFTNAHAVAYITDFGGFAAAAPFMVLRSPFTDGRNTTDEFGFF